MQWEKESQRVVLNFTLTLPFPVPKLLEGHIPLIFLIYNYISTTFCSEIFSHCGIQICCWRVETHILDDAMNLLFLVIGHKINIHSSLFKAGEFIMIDGF